MFQTLKPRKGDQGEVEYVARSSDVGYPRRKRRKPACTSCKVRKLKCNVRDNGSCDQCQKQGIQCSYMEKPNEVLSPSSSASKEESSRMRITPHPPRHPEDQQWSLPQQNQMHPQETLHGQQLQLKQMLSYPESNHRQALSSIHTGETSSSNLNTGYKVNHNFPMLSSSRSIDLPNDMDFMEDIYLDGFDSAQFPPCDLDLHLSDLSNTDNDESSGRPSQSPHHLVSNLPIDGSQMNMGSSTSNGLMPMSPIMKGRSQTHALQRPIPLQTPPPSTTSQTEQRKVQLETSQKLLEYVEPPVIDHSPAGLVQPPRPKSITGGTFCQCIDLLLSAYERLQIQLLSSPGKDHHHKPYHSPRHTALAPINIDETLECQHSILTSISIFLECKECRYRSEYVSLCLTLCREMIRSLKILGDKPSSVSTSGGCTSPLQSGSLSKKSSRRPRSANSRGASEDSETTSGGRTGITSSRWRLEDEVELQVVWNLVELRAERLKKLIWQLEEVAEAKELACLRIAQATSRQFAR